MGGTWLWIFAFFSMATNTPGSNVIASTSGNRIEINESVFNSYSSNLKILVIAHEVGHALGIGVWLSYVSTTGGGVKYLSNTQFPKTAKAYIDNVRPSGVTVPGPPLENGGHGSGSDLVHWEDDPTYGMQKDLMIYRISSSATVISIVDLTYLDEIGRKVDLSKAQSLSSKFYAVAQEFFYGKEECNHVCGTCEDCKHDHKHD